VKTVEANIDGLVGPTHNYTGLSFGNVASEKHAFTVANPKMAALQGLQKMKFLHDLGIPQMVMPPQPRPDFSVMRQLGFKAAADMPKEILYPLYSASSMWAANAATVSPSADTKDGKVHITPANLTSKFHRSIEAGVTADYLRQIFHGPHFAHHAPLPSHAKFSDEGAANHMRLCGAHTAKGTEIFVYGADTKRYPARQSLGASEAIARLHKLGAKNVIFLKQHPDAVDAGVFHNDVIAMSNENLCIVHEKAYENPGSLQAAPFRYIAISEKELPLPDAVSTYFFNSQLVTLPTGGMAVIAPKECEEHAQAKACFDRLMAEGVIATVHYLDVRESMKNGGGPACLRLRVALTEEERAGVHPHIWLNDVLYSSLCRWIEIHYRDRITPDDLRDPLLAEESARALMELSGLLKIKIGTATHDI